MADILNISPTRSSLLEIKGKIALAKKGHSLLKKKQDALINKFMGIVKDYKDKKKSILAETKTAYKSLSLEIAYVGINRCRSLSYSAKETFDIDVQFKNIMGLKLPEMSAMIKNEVHNNLGNSPQMKEVIEKFQKLFKDLIELSSLEITIKSLADEIKKVKRRVNSLEHIQIPKLDNTQKHIKFVLEEQERENFTRLKMIKSRLN